ncbi:MAG: hypothetical protein MHM6MM_008620 [Cercozoa sp. M6MM]
MSEDFMKAVRQKTEEAILEKLNNEDFYRRAVDLAAAVRIGTALPAALAIGLLRSLVDQSNDHPWTQEDTKQLPIYTSYRGDKHWLDQSRLMTAQFNQDVETATARLAKHLLLPRPPSQGEYSTRNFIVPEQTP